MKGLGRNMKYLIGREHMVQILTYIVFVLTFAFLGVLDNEVLPEILKEIPSFLLLISFMLILIVMGMGEVDYLLMNYFGSCRRAAAWGLFLTQHFFLVEQFIILNVVAALAKNNGCMKLLKAVPLGSIAIVLVLVGIAYFINAISISGHKVCAGILLFTLVCVFFIIIFYLSKMYEIKLSAEMLIPYNNIWILLSGVVMDLLGAVVFYKTVTKVDLKLV